MLWVTPESVSTYPLSIEWFLREQVKTVWLVIVGVSSNNSTTNVLMASLKTGAKHYAEVQNDVFSWEKYKKTYVEEQVRKTWEIKSTKLGGNRKQIASYTCIGAINFSPIECHRITMSLNSFSLYNKRHDTENRWGSLNTNRLTSIQR